jgi:hypothetical protein
MSNPSKPLLCDALLLIYPAFLAGGDKPILWNANALQTNHHALTLAKLSVMKHQVQRQTGGYQQPDYTLTQQETPTLPPMFLYQDDAGG